MVGHTEWVEFGRVERVPAAGDIAHSTDAWEAPGGGGAVAAVQLARLAGSCTFFTALGEDERGAWSRRDLQALGVRVEASERPEPNRRAFVLVDDQSERTITTFGRRLDPTERDELAWDELEATDAAYVCAGSPEAIRLARRAAVLVGTTRVMDLLDEADVELDALVGSARDAAERYATGRLTHPPGLLVLTEEAHGGTWQTADGRGGAFDAVAPPGPMVDSYGAGDSFAAGLAFALASKMGLEATLRLAARCGAWCVAGRGPYGNQLTAADLER